MSRTQYTRLVLNQNRSPNMNLSRRTLALAFALV